MPKNALAAATLPGVTIYPAPEECFTPSACYRGILLENASMPHVLTDYCAGPLSLTVMPKEAPLQDAVSSGSPAIAFTHAPPVAHRQPVKSATRPQEQPGPIDKLSLTELRANHWQLFRSEAEAGNHENMLKMAAKAPQYAGQMARAMRFGGVRALSYQMGTQAFTPPWGVPAQSFVAERTAFYEKRFAQIRPFLSPSSIWNRGRIGQRMLIQGDMAEACLMACIAGALEGTRVKGACIHHLLTWQNFAAEQKSQLANLANPRRHSDEAQAPGTPPQSPPARARALSSSSSEASEENSPLPMTPDPIHVDWRAQTSPSCTPRITVLGFDTAAAADA